MLAGGKFDTLTRLVTPVNAGGFNGQYRVRFDQQDITHVIIRRPLPSLVHFIDEKIVQEAATAVYILKIPRLKSCGLKQQATIFSSLGQASFVSGHWSQQQQDLSK